MKNKNGPKMHSGGVHLKGPVQTRRKKEGKRTKKNHRRHFLLFCYKKVEGKTLWESSLVGWWAGISVDVEEE